ncbi:hypothetical protein QQF64_013499 [Cirrhinus molitorella]|uniref:Uncharacterized protein n=1 Tax=Cirrhinus molitorella TaxID=172907 RepID=A0ABR3LVH7_9TELE
MEKAESKKRRRKRRGGSGLCLSWAPCNVFWELEGVTGHQKGAWLRPTIKKISDPLGRGLLSNSFGGAVSQMNRLTFRH